MSNSDDQFLSYTASLVTQGSYRFYTLTMPSDVLAQTSYIVSRDEDPIAGFQRLLKKERAQEIADFIDAGMGTIPTSVVLSAQPDANFTYSARTKTLSFKKTKYAFLILDGQHRVYGFSLAKSELRVPVVIYNGLTRKDESRLFIDINTKQKPVPNELLLDIRKIAEYQNDTETKLGQIYDLFVTEPTSPIREIMSPSKRKAGLISRVTFNAALKPLLAVFGTADVAQIYQVTASYFTAFLAVARDKKMDLKVGNPVVFRSLLAVFPDIAQRVRDKYGKKYDSEKFALVIGEMLSRIKPSATRNVGNSSAAYSKIFTDALKEKTII